MLRTGGASAIDPFIVPDGKGLFAPGCNKDVSGKILSTPRLAPGERTAVFVIEGQSGGANSVDTPYTPAHADKVDNFNIYDGGVYRAVDPLLGCTTTGQDENGNIWGRVADGLIDIGWCDRVILAPIAFGDTSVAHHRYGGELNPRLRIAPQRLAAAGLPVTAFILALGENDNQLGTPYGQIVAGLSEIIATPRNAGFSAPWLVGKCSYAFGVTSSVVQSAQAAVVNGIDVFAGADTDTLTGTAVYRQANDVHLTAAGRNAAASLWVNAIVYTLPSP